MGMTGSGMSCLLNPVEIYNQKKRSKLQTTYILTEPHHCEKKIKAKPDQSKSSSHLFGFWLPFVTCADIFPAYNCCCYSIRQFNDRVRFHGFFHPSLVRKFGGCESVSFSLIHVSFLLYLCIKQLKISLYLNFPNYILLHLQTLSTS